MTGRTGWVEGIYGLLLRVYPSAFRRLYAEEMKAAFSQLHARVAEREGIAGLAWLWVSTGPDILVSGFRERWGRHGYRVNLRSDIRFPRLSAANALRDLTSDVRYAFKTLAKAPGFTAIVVLTMGLGIGANTAIFSVVYGVLIKPLPFGGGGDVVHLHQVDARVPDGVVPAFSVHEINDFRNRNRTLTEVSEYHRMSFALTGQGEPDRVRVGVVSHNFFDLLQVRPALGREFVAAEDRVGAAPVLVLSDGYWRSKFGADETVIGKKVIMNGRPHTIIGVLPPFPQFPQENQVYMPVSICPTRSGEDFIANRVARMMSVYGRLASGISFEEARGDIRRIASELEAEFPEVYPPDVRYAADLALVRDELVEEARSPLILLLAVAGFVLLIASANAANMALARAGRRRSELAVRFAMGAGRGRIGRQLLTENLLLALAGGGLGLLFAFGGLDLLVAYAERFTPRAYEVEIDRNVLLFAAIASVATGLLFGTAPAIAECNQTASALSEGAGTSSRRGRRLQSTLVVVQVSVAFAVLAGAGLMLRSLWELYQVDPGVDTQEVVAFSLYLEEPAYDSVDEVNQFFQQVVHRFLETPNVVAAAVAIDAPMGEPHSRSRNISEVGREADVLNGVERWLCGKASHWSGRAWPREPCLHYFWAPRCPSSCGVSARGTP